MFWSISYISHISQIIANFVLNFSKFSLPGQQGQSRVNLNDIVKLNCATSKTPSLVQASQLYLSHEPSCSKFCENSKWLPWSEVNFDDAIKLSDLEKLLNGARFSAILYKPICSKFGTKIPSFWLPWQQGSVSGKFQ